MMRIRIDGGQLSAQALRVIGEIATEFGRDVADVTDRQNVQLHWIRIEDVPEIWRRLEEVELHTTEACGDSPRVIVGCPLAGVAADEVLDGNEHIREVAQRYLGDPAYANLPRKFKTSISGCSVFCTNHEINDIALVGRRAPRARAGLRPLGRRRACRRTPSSAVRLGAFVDPGPRSRGLAGRHLGLPRLRLPPVAQPRPHEVPDGRLGPGAVPGGAREGVPRRPPPRRPAAGHASDRGARPRRRPPAAATAGSTSAPSPRAGRTSGTQLQRVADLAEQYGGGRVATTAQQGFVVLGVPAEHVDALVDGPRGRGPAGAPERVPPRHHGLHGPGVLQARHRRDQGARGRPLHELERRLPDYREPLTLHVNGCPNSCARFQTGDIGLKGSIVDGVEGFQVHLGGRLGEDAGFGRKERGLKVTADEARRLRRARAAATTSPARPTATRRFAVWARRADAAHCLA